MRCTTSTGGFGGGHKFRVTVAGLQSALSSGTFDYAVPTITSFTGLAAFDTRGGFAVTMVGTNMGPDDNEVYNLPSVTYGPAANPTQFTAASCTVQTAHSTIVCNTVAGFGGQLFWTVTIGGRQGPSTQGNNLPTTYSNPTISALSGVKDNMNTAGGEVVTIAGNFFARTDSGAAITATYTVSVGPTTYQYTTGACTSTVHHTQVECPTQPGACCSSELFFSDALDSCVFWGECAIPCFAAV